MHRILRLGLLLCFAAHVALAAKPAPMDATAAGNGPSRLPTVPNSAYPYYQTIRTFSFDNGGTPSAQGWTTHDLTAQYGTFWHVDDFAGLVGYLPLQGTKSMWCGVRPGVITDPAIPDAPGYGDNWLQILEFPTIINPLGGNRSVSLIFRRSYDMPDTADKVEVEYRSPAGTGSWNLLGTLTGSAAAADEQFTFVAANTLIEFRFVMTSDASASDESFGYDSAGAIILDNIVLRDNAIGFNFYTQNFESYAVGTTDGGSWIAQIPNPVGNYAGLVSGSNVYQDGSPNTTGMWSFFNGSSATWACGGHPSQAAVPYTQFPGSARPSDYVYNEVRSPLIDFTVDQNNQPTDATMSSLAMEFDVYRTSTDGVLPGWNWRFVVNGVLQPWNGASFLTTSSSWFGMTTLRVSGIPIPPGATQVQFSLRASDTGYAGGSYCHSQAPLFDNVRIIRMYAPARVTNTNDSGAGSLRQAIINANSSSDFNAILFFINGAGAHTINLTSPLPAIVNPVWIDGFTQTGSIPNGSQFQSTSAQLMVTINGASAGANANGLWFMPGGYGLVRGVAIGGFSGAGIRYESTSAIVNGCFIGTDGTGNSALPNGTGIRAITGGLDIGGPYLEERNLISTNTGDAIDVMAGECHIFNTHIGYDANGFEFANGDGIHVFGGPYTQIGEPASGDECRGEYTDRVWIELGNIEVEPAAQSVYISQVVMEGGNIDLNIDGETPNDPGDADSGGNGLQNYPVLASVGSNTVTGNMDGAPNTAMHIELFSGDGFQANMHYLGYKDVTTDGSGHTSFSFSCALIAPGTNIRATATAANGTSEFGPWITYNNTAPGSPSSPVSLYDTSNTLRATVQYDNVFSFGNTFLNATTPGSVPNPGTWNVGGTPHYWDISAAVAYSGNVHVCMYYDPAQVPAPETVLRLLHFQNGQWVDVTDTVDPVNNRICGVVSSLSPFVIAARTGATAAGDLPVPDKFALHANIPNPFNPTTTINYDVRRGGADVTIAVYDVSGRLVRTLVHEHRAAGHYQEQWNGFDEAGRPVASGVYFYRMSAASFVETRKMILLK